MKVTFFFRKTLPVYHSIEELFASIQAKLPATIMWKNYFLKYIGNNIFKLLTNCFFAAFHQNEINHITGDIHYISLFLKKKKTILTIHDIDSIRRKGLKGKIIKLLWFTIPVRKAKIITVISEFTKQQLIEYVKVDKNKIFVIPDCISPLIQKSPKNIDKQNLVILQIGTTLNKNVSKVISAIKSIKCKFILVGFQATDYVEQLTENEIDYELYSNLEYSQIMELYKRADIVTFTSTYEGFGMPIIEANGIGRPVITSNISPMKVVANDAAILVNPENVNEIREAINQLINNDVLRESLIQNGYKNAQKYSAENVAKMYVELYKKIVPLIK